MAQAPTTDPTRLAADKARKSVKKLRNVVRDVDRDLAQLDAELVQKYGIDYVEQDTTTAPDGAKE